MIHGPVPMMTPNYMSGCWSKETTGLLRKMGYVCYSFYFKPMLVLGYSSLFRLRRLLCWLFRWISVRSHPQTRLASAEIWPNLPTEDNTESLAKKRKGNNMTSNRREGNQIWHQDDHFWKTFYPILFKEKRWADAQGEIDGATALLDISPSARICDLCCGPGRHSKEDHF